MKLFKLLRLRTHSITFSLRTQLIIYISVFSLVVLILGSFLTYRDVLNLMERRNEQLVLQQFNQIEHNLSVLFEDVDRLSNLFLIDDAAQGFLQKSHDAFVYEDVDTVKKIHNRIKEIIWNYLYVDSVYLFTENKEAIGASEKNGLIIRSGDDVHSFFQTDDYKSVVSLESKKIWRGGYDSKYFNEAIAMERGEDSHVISLIKRVKAIADPRWGAVIVFNIKQEYISSIYNNSESKEGSMYILDRAGTVISGGDKSEIGTVSPLYSKLDLEGNFGSTTLQRNHVATQFVYYKIKDLNWFLIREIPLHLEYGDIVPLQRTFIIVCGASVVTMLVVSFFWIRRLMKPLNILTRKMLDTGRGKLGLTVSNIPKNELGIVIRHFNDMSVSIVELIHTIEEIEKQKRNLEIGALQAQINPHFLYNSLTLIKWMAAAANANNVVDSISVLGKLLRPVFNNTESMWTIQEEKDYLLNYMSIMNLRFSNLVSFKFETDPGLLEYLLPRFILQPIVENAVTHGMKTGSGPLQVHICLEEQGEDILITIQDSGPGIKPEMLDIINLNLASEQRTEQKQQDWYGSGIGIVNVLRRIKLTYGEKYGISLNCPTDGGTRVFLCISKLK